MVKRKSYFNKYPIIQNLMKYKNSSEDFKQSQKNSDELRYSNYLYICTFCSSINTRKLRIDQLKI
jgi:hypothetical protein